MDLARFSLPEQEMLLRLIAAEVLGEGRYDEALELERRFLVDEVGLEDLAGCEVGVVLTEVGERQWAVDRTVALQGDLDEVRLLDGAVPAEAIAEWAIRPAPPAADR